MKHFIEGEDRSQATLFPEKLDSYITQDNPVRVIDVFVGDLELDKMGFKTVPAGTACISMKMENILIAAKTVRLSWSKSLIQAINTCTPTRKLYAFLWTV